MMSGRRRGAQVVATRQSDYFFDMLLLCNVLIG